MQKARNVPFWAQKSGFSEKCRKLPETSRNAKNFLRMSRYFVVCRVLLHFGQSKDIVSRDPKSGHKFKFSAGLI